MFFDNFKDHPDAKINPTLLWEYNIEKIDFVAMRNLIVQRLVERGWLDDWYAMLNLYCIVGVKKALLELPYLNAKDLNFVSKQFDLRLTDFKCYTRKRSASLHWNS